MLHSVLHGQASAAAWTSKLEVIVDIDRCSTSQSCYTCLLEYQVLVAWFVCLLGFGKWVIHLYFYFSFNFFYLRVGWLAKQFVSLCSRQKKLWSQA